MTKLFFSTLKNIFTNKQYDIYNQVRYLRWHNRIPSGVIEAENYDEQKDSRKVKSKEIENNLYEPFKTKKVSYLRRDNRIPSSVIEAENYEQKDFPKVKSKEIENNLREPFKTKILWKHPREKKLNSQNLVHKEKDNSIKYKIDPSIKPLTISNKNKILPQKSSSVDMLDVTIDEDGNFIYTKMENNDVRISKILVNIKSKQMKEEKDCIVLEGKRLIKDALDAGCKLDYILFSRIKDVEYLRPSFPKMGVKLYKMPYREMQFWSDLTTNPGIMGIFKIPDTESYEISPDSLPITVICDNIREGGNLGAVLRTSSGAGCEEVILTKGCVNVWDSKVLRSGSGAHFRLKLYKKLDWEDIKSHIYSYSQIYIADNNILNTSDNEESGNLLEIVNSVPILPYYGVNFATAAHIVLIIGGETEGISEESYRLAAEYKGARLNIPLINNVNSLNTGTALGIIAFEIKRQLMKLKSEQSLLEDNSTV